MTIIYDLPEVWDKLIPQEEMWKIDARTRSGGEGLTLREQVVSSGLGRWRANRVVRVRTRAQILAARQLIAILDGRANAIMAGPCDCLNAPSLTPPVTRIPYSQPVFHSDTAGFQQGGIKSTVEGAASAGDFQVYIHPRDMIGIEAGVYIGLGSFLYIVTEVVSTNPVTGIMLLNIKPRLRASVSIGTIAEWCKPRAPMRLSSDDVGDLPLQLARFGSLNLSLVEYY